jgi:NAD+ kinase
LQNPLRKLIYEAAMKLNRVLVITKAHPPTRGRKGFAMDRTHATALSAVLRAIEGSGASAAVAPRHRIPRAAGFDLIVPVGGDGTFLAAAHEAGRVPLLGVNADPARSVGFFCPATVRSFPRLIKAAAAGSIEPREAPLIETSVDGRALPCLALNDVLFAAASPAEMVRYEIRAGGRAEEQRSSGVWISSGPGSSAAIRSAGGRPIGMLSRRLQFLVREPCPMPGVRYRLIKGVLPMRSSVVIRPLMHSAVVYIDGHWHSYPVRHGARVSCRVSPRTLRIFA